MKHFATALLGFGIMLAALPTARAADTTCINNTISNTTINGNLVVSVYCALYYVTVTGNVQVQTNAQLIIVEDSTIDGNLSVGTGAYFETDSAFTVDGNIEANQCRGLITNYFFAPNSPIIVGGNVHIQSCVDVEFLGPPSPEKNEIGGNFTCGNSQFRCTLGNTNVNGGVQFTNNAGGGPVSFSDVEDNTIGGNLQCQGNGEIFGGGNTVGGHKTGQCANF